MASAEVLSLTFQHNPAFKVVDTGVRQLKRKRSGPFSSNAMSNMTASSSSEVTFDPSRHLNYSPPTRVWSMEDLALSDRGISPNAVSEPFELFTPEAIKQMRAEVFSQEVMQNCQYSSNLAQSQLRGMAPDYAPFVYQTWRSPEVLSIVSKIAGVDLVPALDFEIGHINISVSTEDQTEAVNQALLERAHREADEGVSGCPWEDDEPIVDWHTDSYPFVCVTMLSDCTNMVGGETALRTGTGDIMKVRGPAMGHAVVLQGRYIEHQALRALGSTERITMVTSFRPRSAFVKDDTVLTTVRPISDLSELYSQYTDYRLEMLEKRIRAHRQQIQSRKRTHEGFSTFSTKSFLREQASFLETMLKEMVDEDKVVKGFTDDSHLLSADLKEHSRKKARLVSDDSA